MRIINIDLMREPMNWPLVAVMAWVGMIAMSQLFAPRMREREMSNGAGVTGIREME